jgi:hypothetical protein
VLEEDKLELRLKLKLVCLLWMVGRHGYGRHGQHFQ